MSTPEEHLVLLWPLGVWFAAVLVVVTSMIAGSFFLGPRRRHEGMLPYEGGLPSAGSSHLRMTANFYLVAMFFVVFDLEAVFIFAWAVGLRESGWRGYAEALVFIVLLLAGLVYLWRLGALDWGTSSRLRHKRRQES